MCFVTGFAACIVLDFLVRDVVVFVSGIVPLWFCLDPVSLGVSDSKVLVLCVLPAFPCALKLLALRDKFKLASSPHVLLHHPRGRRQLFSSVQTPFVELGSEETVLAPS